MHLIWAAGEQESWNAIPDPTDHNNSWFKHYGTMPDLDAYGYRRTRFLAHGVRELAEPRLDGWTGDEYQDDYQDDPTDRQRILARFGERVVDRVLPESTAYLSLELPGPILSLNAARIVGERLVKFKDAHPSARQWLDRHGVAAVPYLVPDALGSSKPLRKNAEAALARLAEQFGAAAVAAQAEMYGPEAAAAIAVLVGDNPLLPSVKVPKPGPWAVPTALPQVLLKGGERSLPADSVGHLITVLALATPDYPYRGLEVVAESCDRDSLSRFSFALFEQWLKSDAPSKDRWALTQLAHFADDAITSRLAELVREWPNNNQHKRAVTGLEVLAVIDTEDALRALQQVADKVKFKALKAEAGRQITAIAKRLGLSREQLADRLVPDFGLDEQDALVLRCRGGFV